MKIKIAVMAGLLMEVINIHIRFKIVGRVKK